VTVRSPVLIALVILGLVAACGPTGAGLPAPQSTWPTVRATIDGRELHLIVADDHGVGMRGITDLGQLDGMLFAYPAAVAPGAIRFSMQGVTVDLDGHFFDAAGALIESIHMAACQGDPCPTYGPDHPFRWAIEAPSGRLTLPVGARLVVSG
jgi:uncharacterized membrane protein (UPF0127 family)